MKEFSMSKRDTTLDIAVLGIGALVGIGIINLLATPRRSRPNRQLAMPAPASEYDVLYSVHGADFRYSGESDAPAARTLHDARREAQRFVAAGEILEARAVVVNLRTGEQVAEFGIA
jgi:hypothetical protein